MSQRGRPSHLAPREPITGTYLDEELYPAISLDVDAITAHSLEQDVRNAWNDILGTVFTVQEGYTFHHEFEAGPGQMDITVSRVVNRHQTNFLVLELKRASYANSDSNLQTAGEQLRGYLGSLTRTSGVRANKIWGALCIGKGVQFYGVKNVGNVLQLETLHVEMIRIDRQPETVVGYLEYIKSKAT